MQQRPIPILITWDVDPDRWATPDRRQRALSMVLDLCEEFGIRSTFFVTANYAHEYPEHMGRMQSLGHEVGCHGLTHTDEEDYDRMPEDMQRTYIEEATQKLAAAVGEPILTFRSPRVKTSASTLRLLAEYGYKADSSVCSQRIDFVSSNLINPGWIIAPRRPYSPDPTNAFKRGNLPLWEVPVSAMGLPFISNALNALGVSAMKAFFKLLYTESKHTGKPIVYLGHPTEFILQMSGKGKRHYFKLRELSPNYIRTHGLLLRNYLFKMNGETLFNATQELFAYMASYPGIEFLPVGQYVSTHLEKVSRSTKQTRNEDNQRGAPHQHSR
jgi:peptidoglycan/xylan/chitin deacetylase (PgdA/CDA1 family)